MSGDNSESEKWKGKYLEVLEQLEEKERDWRRTDESLRHGLSRLALLSSGLNSGLDVQLRKLRSALQKEVKSDYLDELVAKISDYLKTMDEAGGVEGVADPQAVSVELLLRIVDTLEFPSQCHSRVKRLRRDLAGRNAAIRLEPLVEEFADLVSSAFYRDKASGAGMQGGWWKRFFGGGDKSAAAPSPGDADAGQAVSAGQTLEMALLHFLSSLAVPAEFVPRLQGLKRQLEAGLSVETVGGVVKGMVTLVNDVQQQLEREKEELEMFLDQLSQRLQDLDAMVDGAETQRQASLASGRELDEMVSAQVNDIEQTVEDATDIGQMKGAIQGSLENIRRHLAQRRQQEEARQTALEQQLKSLNHRLVEMEDESDKLRTRLAQERVQAMTDPLTSVANRLGYEKRVEQEFARWRRYGGALTMLVCDIDHFKRINDSYGHKAGDRALMAIAKSLNQHLRQTDFVARIGGEEFIVLLPETDLKAAEVVAEKLRKGVEVCEFVYEDAPVPITMSCGVAIFSKGDEVETVFNRADKALYQAKQQGRNRFISAD